MKFIVAIFASIVITSSVQAQTGTAETESIVSYMEQVFAMHRCNNDCSSVELLDLKTSYNYRVDASRIGFSDEGLASKIYSYVEIFSRSDLDNTIKIYPGAEDEASDILFRLVPAEIDSNIFASCTRRIVVDSNVVVGAVIDIPIDQDVTKIRSTFPYCINLALNTIFDFGEHLDSSLSPDMEATQWTRAYWRAMLLLRSQDVPDLSKLQAYLYDNL